MVSCYQQRKVICGYDFLQAKKTAVEKNQPVLIEAMTYRGGHHSTSDDSSRYRAADEITFWQAHNNPITRLRLYLESKKAWTNEQEAQIRFVFLLFVSPLILHWCDFSNRLDARTQVLGSLARAEGTKKPAPSQLFTDVYHDIPQHLLNQQQELLGHLQKYGKEYSLDEWASNDTYVDPSKQK